MRVAWLTTLSIAALSALLSASACGSSDAPATASAGTTSSAGSASGGAPAQGGSNSAGATGALGGSNASGGGTAAGASGSSAGSAGSAGSGAVDPGPCKPRPVTEDGDVVIYCSGVAQWEIYDKQAYLDHQQNFDEIIKLLDQGYAGIAKRTGQAVAELPIRVVIGKDDCCGGWTGGGDVGYNDGNFKDDFGMDWIRGVVLGEVVNAVTGNVTGAWPTDWWVNSVWYFPGFIAVDVLREVSGAERATKWETDEKYPTYPIYNLFLALKKEKDWAFYQSFFASIKKDQMDWGAVGDNPSALKTNYVIAYMSLAYGQNLGSRFAETAKAPGTDATVVQSIMDAHAKLIAADGQGKSTGSNWSKFRKGDYAGAAQGL